MLLLTFPGEELFPEDQWKKMDHGADGAWTVEIALPDDTMSIDFFSTHGKVLHRKSDTYQTCLSSPYTRVKLPAFFKL